MQVARQIEDLVLESMPIAGVARVAFAPMANSLMAVGADDGAILNSNHLKLLKVDISSSDVDMPVLGSIVVPERFNRLSWSNVGAEAIEGFPLGVIAGGLADGSIHFWNPHRLLSGDPTEQEAAVVYQIRGAHSGYVSGLEFSPLAPKYLASGGMDGALIIRDWTTQSVISSFRNAEDVSYRGRSEISFVSWNRKVQHIVASTSYSGTCDFWDLRRAKPVISFKNPISSRHYSTFQWNPEVATELIVASAEDGSPSLQVWDLRNSVSPTKELFRLTKGVNIAMAWCPYDSSLLLTCSKDNQTLCWDTGLGEILSEFPVTDNMNVDVQWSPGTRGVLSTSSSDGKICIYDIKRTVSTRGSNARIKKAPISEWSSLPSALQALVLGKLSFRELLSFKEASPSLKLEVEALGKDLTFLNLTAIHFFVEEGSEAWQCGGFDLLNKKWRRLLLPASSCLPPVNPFDPYKEYSVCGHRELMCIDASEWPEQKGKYLVFNPWTGEKIELPNLKYPRNPTVSGISVNSETGSFQVVVAGAVGTSDLAGKVEVFNSGTSEWEVKGELPRQLEVIQEKQAAIFVNGIFYFIANRPDIFGGMGLNIFAYDVRLQGILLEDKTCQVPLLRYSLLQLVESEGLVYLFSEQEVQDNRAVHCIDQLEIVDGGCKLRNILRVEKPAGQNAVVDPEYTCVGFGKDKVCIINTMSRVGRVYDVRDGTQCEVLPSPPYPVNNACKFSANAVTFALQLKGRHAMESWLRMRQVSTQQAEVPSEKHSLWSSLPPELREEILDKLHYRDQLSFKEVSRSSKLEIEAISECIIDVSLLGSKLYFTGIHFIIEEGSEAWQCRAFDLLNKRWRRLPISSYLPPLDPFDPYKEFSICGHREFMCVDESEWPHKGELVVINLLTGERISLPRLCYPRNPAIIHISVNSKAESFKVVVAGAVGRPDLAGIMEVYNSGSPNWKTYQLPGELKLQEKQTAISVKEMLYFFVRNTRVFLVSHDLRQSGRTTVFFPIALLNYNILQLIESEGMMYLFSEQLAKGDMVLHCIEELQHHQWGLATRNVLTIERPAGPSAQVDPEYVCVAFGKGKVCIMNTLSYAGRVYDVRDGTQCGELPSPPRKRIYHGCKFSANPVTFSLEFILNDRIRGM